MLDRIHIENYKCLRDVTVDLGKFTILIGPNDSGKTSFLDAIGILSRIVRYPFASIFTGDNTLENLVWQRRTDLRIKWQATGTASGEHFQYHVEVPVGNEPPVEILEFGEGTVVDTRSFVAAGSDPTTYRPRAGATFLGAMNQDPSFPTKLKALVAALESSIEFHFDPTRMASASVPKLNASLDPTGDNLAGFLDSLLTGPNRSAFSKLEGDLHSAIPSLRGISLQPAADPPGPSGAKSLRFILAARNSEPATIPAALASGGALLLTAFLALSYSRTPDILRIEEPENGLHPSRLQMVVDVLRKMTTGELGGRPRQIIITTHNPLLLNCAEPEEVRVFVRDAEKGTQVKKIESIPDADRLLKEFALGELWYLLGEEKMFEEQPA